MRRRLMPIPSAIGWVLAGLLAAAAVPTSARAEISNDGLLGPGLRSRPAYDGSASRRLELVPVVRAFGPTWFARSTQGVAEAGGRLEWMPGLHVGAQLAYEGGRSTGESEFLRRHELSTVPQGVSLGLHLEWDHLFGPMPVTLLLRTRSHTDAGRGHEADLRLSAGFFQAAGFAAGVFTQARWADSKAVRSIYGVDAPTAARTGLAVFQPGGGWLNVGAGLLGSWILTPSWMVVGSLELRRLRGDAAQSPLAERRTHTYASTGVAWRF